MNIVVCGNYHMQSHYLDICSILVYNIFIYRKIRVMQEKFVKFFLHYSYFPFIIIYNLYKKNIIKEGVVQINVFLGKIMKFLLCVVVSVVSTFLFSTSCFASSQAEVSSSQAEVSSNQPKKVSQAKKYTIPGSQGTLTSNCYRQTFATYSGNTIQWNWQASAVYAGTKKVQRIRTTWFSSASLRNSASMSMGIGADSVSASNGSSWASCSTSPKYWENTNGAKSSDKGSNIAIGPSGDYRSFSICTFNNALVKLSSDPKTYEINASV